MPDMGREGRARDGDQLVGRIAFVIEGGGLVADLDLRRTKLTRREGLRLGSLEAIFASDNSARQRSQHKRSKETGNLHDDGEYYGKKKREVSCCCFREQVLEWSFAFPDVPFDL